ncbi:MAG: hypothetical protein KKF54_01020 [Candidatus Omnitrophica bacterium]|nr:hypothetical protein [Candidatus Omnitrophota bacterium]
MSKSEEKRKNCGNCNKSLLRVKRYYRNGKYFCNKSCFQTGLKKEKAA